MTYGHRTSRIEPVPALSPQTLLLTDTHRSGQGRIWPNNRYSRQISKDLHWWSRQCFAYDSAPQTRRGEVKLELRDFDGPIQLGCTPHTCSFITDPPYPHPLSPFGPSLSILPSVWPAPLPEAVPWSLRIPAVARRTPNYVSKCPRLNHQLGTPPSASRPLQPRGRHTQLQQEGHRM